MKYIIILLTSLFLVSNASAEDDYSNCIEKIVGGVKQLECPNCIEKIVNGVNQIECYDFNAKVCKPENIDIYYEDGKMMQKCLKYETTQNNNTVIENNNTQVIKINNSASEILEKGNVVDAFFQDNKGNWFSWVAYKNTTYVCQIDLHIGVLTDNTNVICYPISDRGVGKQME